MRGPGYVAYKVGDVLNKLTVLGLAQYVSICSDYSWNILNQWAGEKINLLFIDGAHYPDDLKADLEWARLIKPGGFLVVDDWFKEIRENCLDYLADKPFKLLHESTDAATEEFCVTIFRQGL
jgi:predicted O-methyltransferase YrrM